MALAPAFIVSNMVSSEGPPVAIMGSFGYSFLILATIFGVSVEADTFNILAPAFILPSKSIKLQIKMRNSNNIDAHYVILILKNKSFYPCF